MSSDKLDRRPDPSRASPSALDSADPPRNFSLSVDQRIRALAIGAPAWSTRKRRIEDAEARLVRELVVLHDKLVAKGGSPTEVESAMTEAAFVYDLTNLNALVTTHNRYYAIEANLPMDRKSGAYLVYGRPWRPEEPYSAMRLLTLARGLLQRRVENDP